MKTSILLDSDAKISDVTETSFEYVELCMSPS